MANGGARGDIGDPNVQDLGVSRASRYYPRRAAYNLLYRRNPPDPLYRADKPVLGRAPELSYRYAKRVAGEFEDVPTGYMRKSPRQLKRGTNRGVRRD